MRPVDAQIKYQLRQGILDIAPILKTDVITIVSPIIPGIELQLRQAIESLKSHRESVSVILDTPGGVVEVVERMVNVLRHIYTEVTAIIPDRAMSAGTIFALSADRIMMDHLSCLGPIDPQIDKDGKLVPALSYLNQFERLNQKAQSRELTTAEYALLNKLDLGELYQFERAKALSIDLLIKWLTQYKFKKWTQTTTNKNAVTDDMKKQRAHEIANLLNNPEKWHSHARAIDAKTLREEVNLKIESLEENPELYRKIRRYFELLCDYMVRENLGSFVHSEEYF